MGSFFYWRNMRAGKHKPLNYQPGERFGRLTIIENAGKSKYGHTQFLCQCDCGNTTIVNGAYLKSGNTRSCGCLVRVKPGNKTEINRIIYSYKDHAKERNLVWDLSFDDVKYLIHEPCYYCGAIDSNTMSTYACPEGYKYNGIDRIDSTQGYPLDNTVPCCLQCNRAKNCISQKDFILWLQKAAKHTKHLAEQYDEDADELIITGWGHRNQFKDQEIEMDIFEQ